MAGVSEEQLSHFTTGLPTHVVVRRLEEIYSKGFTVPTLPLPVEACTQRDLPQILRRREYLTGYEIICFTGTNPPHAQYISKSFSELQKLSPAFFYIKYYAHVLGRDTIGGEKHIFVRPVLHPDSTDHGGKVTSLRITNNFEWVEEIVELDMDAATNEYNHFNGFEFGIRNFESTDFFVIERFGIVQGVQQKSVSLKECRKLFDPFRVIRLQRENSELRRRNEREARYRPNTMETVYSCVLKPFYFCWWICTCCFRSNARHGYEGI